MKPIEQASEELQRVAEYLRDKVKAQCEPNGIRCYFVLATDTDKGAIAATFGEAMLHDFVERTKRPLS